MSLQPGQILSHYRLVEKIGEGGMGLVWKAVDTSLDREVAIKFLPDHLARDVQRLARFEREAKTVAALNHPNIVTIHSVEECQGSRFLTMELIPGRTLADLIPDAGLPLKSFIKLALPITEALGAAHERGVTHRDLKPANIMVGREGRVKILDFGLAKPVEDPPLSSVSDLPTRPLTQEGRLAGTIPYMSPEQVRGKLLDHRSDIFSLGVVLYQMGTGRLPFMGDTAADLIASILRDAPPLVSEVNDQLPSDLGRIVHSCLEKDPERRPPSVLGIRNQLEDLRRSFRSAREQLPPSIAVLPFADMSPDRDQDYFCEGVAEEIINSLTKIKGLRVASRTSAFECKAAGMESRKIGRRLRVNTLLEGSVRKAGERLRITVELTDVAEGFHMWSERYDRKTKDVFTIQDEIARSVVEALKVTLSPRERSALQKVHTRHVQAYDCYLRGRKYYYQYRRKGIEFALRMFSRAIDLDPSYAFAYAGIADCCSYLYLYAGRDPANWKRADAASARALELDPDLAQAYASRGFVLSLSDRHDEAERAFETAIRLDPDLFEAHYFYARASFAQGKLEKSVRLYERASELRPEDYQSPLLMAQIYEDLGRAFAAEAARRRGLRIAEERLELNPDDTRALSLGANALVALGEKQRGLEWTRRAVELDPDDPMLLYNVGCIQSLAGETEEAIGSLERSVELGLTQREWFQMDSNLDPLRDHPRFQALMQRLSRMT